MDSVNKPQHYQQGHIETIYAIEQTLGPEGFKAYCMGNWMKYKSRAAYKGNADEDLKKAEVYLGWAINGLPPLNVKAKTYDPIIPPDELGKLFDRWIIKGGNGDIFTVVEINSDDPRKLMFKLEHGNVHTWASAGSLLVNWERVPNE